MGNIGLVGAALAAISHGGAKAVPTIRLPCYDLITVKIDFSSAKALKFACFKIYYLTPLAFKNTIPLLIETDLCLTERHRCMR